jgi:hypothetical protein
VMAGTAHGIRNTECETAVRHDALRVAADNPTRGMIEPRAATHTSGTCYRFTLRGKFAATKIENNSKIFIY